MLVTGSFCEQPPLGLIKTLERAGCYIVDDDFVQIHRWIRSDIATDGDPIESLVHGLSGRRDRESDALHRRTAAKARTWWRASRESGAEGVLFCAPSFCDPALLDQPMAVRAIERRGIPWTAFKYSENSGQFQVIREQAGTFADSIKLWSRRMTAPAAVPADVRKDASQVRQKEMIARHFDRLAAVPESGEKSVYTFVPGNLTELLLSFGLVPVLPEINALQSAMRGKTAEYIAIAEKHGHSEDVCTYVKSDVGMMKSGNVGPTGQRLPTPDLLLLSYTGCFTFMKWFELLREEYQRPVAMLHVPYQARGPDHDRDARLRRRTAARRR